jgi:hypothetical protein
MFMIRESRSFVRLVRHGPGALDNIRAQTRMRQIKPKVAISLPYLPEDLWRVYGGGQEVFLRQGSAGM